MTEDEMVGWHHQLMDMSLSKLWELAMDRDAWDICVHGVSKTLDITATALNFPGQLVYFCIKFI